MTYSDISADEQFKALDEIYKGDTRFLAWGPAKEISYIHAELDALKLSENLAKDFRIEFDLSRNVFLYSYHSYRLTNVSAQMALGCLEKYLRYILQEKLALNLKKDTLTPMVNESLERDIVTPNYFLETNIHNKEHLRQKYLHNKEAFKNYLKVIVTDYRNDLTHDLHKANIPWNNLDVLRNVVGIINYLHKKLEAAKSLDSNG